MALFLIEFRLHGYAKEYTKGLIYDVAKKFRVKGVTRKRPPEQGYSPWRYN